MPGVSNNPIHSLNPMQTEQLQAPTTIKNNKFPYTVKIVTPSNQTLSLKLNYLPKALNERTVIPIYTLDQNNQQVCSAYSLTAMNFNDQMQFVINKQGGADISLTLDIENNDQKNDENTMTFKVNSQQKTNVKPDKTTEPSTTKKEKNTTPVTPFESTPNISQEHIHEEIGPSLQSSENTKEAIHTATSDSTIEAKETEKEQSTPIASEKKSWSQKIKNKLASRQKISKNDQQALAAKKKAESTSIKEQSQNSSISDSLIEEKTSNDTIDETLDTDHQTKHTRLHRLVKSIKNLSRGHKKSESPESFPLNSTLTSKSSDIKKRKKDQKTPSLEKDSTQNDILETKTSSKHPMRHKMTARLKSIGNKVTEKFKKEHKNPVTLIRHDQLNDEDSTLHGEISNPNTTSSPQKKLNPKIVSTTQSSPPLAPPPPLPKTQVKSTLKPSRAKTPPTPPPRAATTKLTSPPTPSRAKTPPTPPPRAATTKLTSPPTPSRAKTTPPTASEIPTPPIPPALKTETQGISNTTNKTQSKQSSSRKDLLEEIQSTKNGKFKLKSISNVEKKTKKDDSTEDILKSALSKKFESTRKNEKEEEEDDDDDWK
ncbi:MAG: hypothetical protein HAW62_01350 [Endozoicomonadaceae bacterium]|nr:hypothetical protein [Endozoicomonadaceae bacterium]